MTPLEWVGAIVAVIVVMGCASLCIGYMLDVMFRQWDRIVWKSTERQLRERGTQMRYQHYWWSTPEQAAVWIACAEHLADGNYPDVQQVRDATYRRCLDQVLESRKTGARIAPSRLSDKP